MKISSYAISVLLLGLVALPAFAKETGDSVSQDKKAALQKRLQPTAASDQGSAQAGVRLRPVGHGRLGELCNRGRHGKSRRWPRQHRQRADVSLRRLSHKAESCSKLTGFKLQYYNGASVHRVVITDKIATCRTSGNYVCSVGETTELLYPN